jgi:hypothetical protein
VRVVIILAFRKFPAHRLCCLGILPATATGTGSPRFLADRLTIAVRIRSGQVAQVVERSPEKAGVGGSTPSLATILSITCTSRVSLFGCNWLQFPSEHQLIVVPRPLNLLTTRCWLSGTNC